MRRLGPGGALFVALFAALVLASWAALALWSASPYARWLSHPGWIDATSFAGKVVGGVLEWAADAGTPHVAVIAGQVTDDAREEMALHANAQLLPLTDRVWQSAETFARAAVLVEEAALEAGRAVLDAP